MKKVYAILLAAVLLMSAVTVTAAAEEAAPGAEVYVTVADAEGKLALAQEKIAVTDTDADGKLTVNDALYCAHEAKYEGGAAAGYGAAGGQYGLSLTKLWGTENGGSYGYYVNNVASMGLTDPVKAGDYVNAFVYTDLQAWSDAYCYFDVNTVEADAGKEITLTLTASGYDASFQPITYPVEGATVTVDGEATQVKTDAQGKAVLTVAAAGEHVISAVGNGTVLVPPVCRATVKAAEKPQPEQKPEPEQKPDPEQKPEPEQKPQPQPQPEQSPATGDRTAKIVIPVVLVVALAVVAVVVTTLTRKKNG